jgi:hypothetical protein
MSHRLSRLRERSKMFKVDGFNWRGGRPKDLSDLIYLGFQRVINLQSGTEDYLTTSRYEDDLNNPPPDIEIFELRWSNIFPPTKKQAERIIELLKVPKQTYIHCHSGVDRTGAAILLHLCANHGWAFETAWKNMKSMGMHPWFFWWKPFLRRLI